MTEEPQEAIDPEMKMFVRDLYKHVVSMAIRYSRSDEMGKADRDIYFAHYSAFVTELNGQWLLLTAGHVVQEILDATMDKAICLEEQSLVDVYGPEATIYTSLPFKCTDNPSLRIDEGVNGMDAALIVVRDLYKANLEKNGIVPLPIVPTFSHNEGKSYALVGFPEEKIHPPSYRNAVERFVKGVYIPLKYAPDHPDSDEVVQMVFSIKDKGKLISVKGMSGGPIIQFEQIGDRQRYAAIAIQARERKSEPILLATPIKTFVETAQAWLKQQAHDS